VGLFQSLAWMANPKGLVVAFDRGRARDCRSCRRLALQRCPGLQPRWQQLAAAHLAQRPAPTRLRGSAAKAEAAVQRALRGGTVVHREPSPNEVAPVWLWIEVLPSVAAIEPTQNGESEGASDRAAASRIRRRTRRIDHRPGRAPLLLASRAESLMTWSEHMPQDRATDDEDNGDAVVAAALSNGV